MRSESNALTFYDHGMGGLVSTPRAAVTLARVGCSDASGSGGWGERRAAVVPLHFLFQKRSLSGTASYIFACIYYAAVRKNDRSRRHRKALVVFLRRSQRTHGN